MIDRCSYCVVCCVVCVCVCVCVCVFFTSCVNCMVDCIAFMAIHLDHKSMFIMYDLTFVFTRFFELKAQQKRK
jgi:hypothetical protein